MPTKDAASEGQEILTAERKTCFKINFKKGRCAIDTEQLHLVEFRLCEHQEFLAL